MKQVYLDTNVVLALIRHNDPHYPLIETIHKQSHLQLVTGTITLAELSSILAREDHIVRNALLQLSKDPLFTDIVALPKQHQIKLIIEYLITYLNIQLINDLAPEPLSLHGTDYNMYIHFKLTQKYSSVTNLRTLDNIHFFTAKLSNDLSNYHISYLVTADKDFLSKRNECKRISDIVIIHPQSFVEIECKI